MVAERGGAVSGAGVEVGRPFDVDVLVVGTGPAGATAALALATQGLTVRMITRWGWLANSPRAHITNQRAMEVLRDLGVEDKVKHVGTAWDQMGEMIFAYSLTGREVARLHTWGTGADRASDYLTGSPCPLVDVPQPLMEPILVEEAAARGAELRTSTEYLRHEQDEEGVTSHLRDDLTGHEYTVRSRYLVGADGARSQIVEELGLPIEGEMGRAGTVYARFHADLTTLVEHRPSILHRILVPAFGEIGMSTLRAVKPWTDWIAGWGYDVDGPAPDLSADHALHRIRAMIGDDTVEVKVDDVTAWKVNQAWATEYSRGRVFCVGDAVHRHPPSSGLGSNTSMQDSFNLAWKLAYVVRGWALPRLLDTYSVERAPIGRSIVARANQSRADYEPLNSVLKAIERYDGPFEDLLLDPGDEGLAAREMLVEAIDRKNDEFNAHGTELNQRYASEAVIDDESAEQEVWLRSPGRYLQRSTRPGAKLPHAWLVNLEGAKVSTLDVTGHGLFSVVTGVSGVAWADAVRRLELPYLRCVTIGGKDVADVFHDWYRVREIPEAGALLVRPDGYVAWRHGEDVHDERTAADLLVSAMSAVGLTVDAHPSGGQVT